MSPSYKGKKSERRSKESLIFWLDELLLVVAAAAGTLILVTWKGIAFETLHAVGMEEMRAGEKVDGFAPERHQTDSTLLIFAANSPLLNFLPIDTNLHLNCSFHS
jgi:hypothetical protein